MRSIIVSVILLIVLIAALVVSLTYFYNFHFSKDSREQLADDSTTRAAVHRKVAITFNHLPSTSKDLAIAEKINEGLLRELESYSIPAVGFVRGGEVYTYTAEIDDRKQLICDWLEKGHHLGNNGFSQLDPHLVNVGEYKRGVIRCEILLKDLLEPSGRKLLYFRYPGLQTGPTISYKLELEDFLRNRGYVIAPVTIECEEHKFAAAFESAALKGEAEAMENIGTAYVNYMETVFGYYEKLSLGFLGREIPQVLQLHANLLNAEYSGRLYRMLGDRGYSFTSLEEVLADPAYSLPTGQSDAGESWFFRWMKAKEIESIDYPSMPQVPQFIEIAAAKYDL